MDIMKITKKVGFQIEKSIHYLTKNGIGMQLSFKYGN
jgi:hypothetical protein